MKNKRKGRSVQQLLGIQTFTKYGLLTDNGELLFYRVAPTNISVLSAANIEIKIRHLQMLLSAIPDLEIICTDSCECFDDNKAYLHRRAMAESNPEVRGLLLKDKEMLTSMEFDLSQSRLTTKEEILANARIGYEDMQSEISMSGDVAAVLNFKEDLSDSDFRVYINKNSNHPNYVFRRGADLTSVERAAYLLEYDGTYVLISLNAFRIAEIRCENGTTYSVNPDSPFVIVIPNGGSLLSTTENGVTYYHGYTGMKVFDEQGNEIDLTQKQWFEMAKLS